MSPPRFSTLRASALGLLLLLLLLRPGSPTLAQRPLDRLSDSITVLEVEVEVEALVDGRPLRGLEIDDYVVLDRGQQREIISFEVIDVGRGRDSGTDGSGAGERVAATTPPTSQRRAFLALLDFQYTPAGLLARSIRSLRSMIDEQVQPGDRMAIVALGGTLGAQVLVGFTSDPVRLHLALDLADAIADRKGKRQRHIAAQLREIGPGSDQELAEEFGAAAARAYGESLTAVTFRPEIDISAGGNFQPEPLAPQVGGAGIEDIFQISADMAIINRFRQTRRYAEALGNLGTLFRSVDGQKHALLLSQGPPLDTLVSTAGGNQRFGTQGIATAMERAFEQLNRAGWRLHTFSQGLSFNSSLFYLADGTGGTSYEAFNRLERATAALLEQTSVSYRLRFLASDIAMDGRRHRLRVEVVDPPKGLELRHRSHYYAPRPPGALTDIERRLGVAERQLETERRSSMELRAAGFMVPEVDGDRAMVVVSMDGEELQRVATEQSVDLELWILPSQAVPQDRVHQRLEIDLARFARAPRNLVFLADLTVPREVDRLEIGARSGRHRWRAAVQLDRARAPALLPPLFAPPATGDSQATRLVLRENSDEEPVQMPFTVGGQELVPALEPRLEAGQRLGVVLAAFDLPDEGGEVSSRVVDLLGREHPRVKMSLRASELQERALLHLAVLETKGLGPGAYTLEVQWSGIERPPVKARFRIIE